MRRTVSSLSSLLTETQAAVLLTWSSPPFREPGPPLQGLPLHPLLATRAETRLKSEHKPTAKALSLSGEKRDCLYIQGAAGPGYKGQQEPGRQAWKWILEVPNAGEQGIKLDKATC